MDIRSESHDYQIFDLVAETDRYRLYLCLQEDTGRQCLLQIAKAVEQNGGLDRAAFMLSELKKRSDELEDEYALIKSDPKDVLNYQLQFPELLDSFICPEQGGRRINILAFRCVEDVSKMVPLINITEKDRLRVDLRTSAWIMGKLLKFLVFTHGESISVKMMGDNNILLEPDYHYVLVFDLSDAHIYPEAIPLEARQQDIARAAQAVIIALGGDLETGIFPDDGEESFKQYTEHLLQLARGSESRAKKAHERFYALVDSLWKKEFYPFTTHSLT